MVGIYDSMTVLAEGGRGLGKYDNNENRGGSFQKKQYDVIYVQPQTTFF